MIVATIPDPCPRPTSCKLTILDIRPFLQSHGKFEETFAWIRNQKLWSVSSMFRSCWRCFSIVVSPTSNIVGRLFSRAGIICAHIERYRIHLLWENANEQGYTVGEKTVQDFADDEKVANRERARLCAEAMEKANPQESEDDTDAWVAEHCSDQMRSILIHLAIHLSSIIFVRSNMFTY